MEAWLSVLIGVVVFALVALVVSRKYRNAVLEKLAPLPEETTLFEEDGVRVEQIGGTRPVVFLNCLVRITNQRLIIAQKGLFGDRRFLRFVINLQDPEGRGASVSTAMKVGYMVGDVPGTQFRKELEGDIPFVYFPLGGGFITAGQAVHVYTERPDELLAALSVQ